jgi:two-component sensor histidine kinase
MEDEVRSKEQLLEELKIRNRILEIFFNCGYDKTYEEILQFLLPAFASKHGIFGYFTQDRQFVVRAQTINIGGELSHVRDKEVIFPPGAFTGTWAQAIQERKVLYNNSGPFQLPNGHIPITNSMLAPVIYRDQTIGAILIANTDNGYNDRDRALLEMIAHVIAPVLNSGLQKEQIEKERDEKEAQLKKALEEKELLLRELYHRTKNNMQVISSMLTLQTQYAKNKEVEKIIRQTEDRIRAMSLVHRKLYQSKDLSRLSIREYIHELAHLLMQSYKVTSQKIVLNLEIEDFMVLIDTAIPCGLLLNELVSNALKHAFPGEKRGEITIRVSRSEQGDIDLYVSDTGAGVPPGTDFENQETMGIKSIITIARHQLQGQVTFETDNPGHGIACHVHFKDNLYSQRV